MKSSKEDLRRRGYIEDINISDYFSIKSLNLINMIDDKEAYKRTLAIRLLCKNNEIKQLDFHRRLLKRLVIEKSLYTKIEICNTLESGEYETLIEMLKYIGKIGNNQYKNLPNTVSKKVSYPLPRDIIARTIAKMNISVLPLLLEEINACGMLEARELIDAIGFLCFYNKESEIEIAIKGLMECYDKYREDNIIRWKIVIALSAFKNKLVDFKLKEIIEVESINIIKKEAERSLKLINR